MKKIISILFLYTFSILSIFAQHNYAQELVNLLQEGKCFEARELRMQHSDKLPQNDIALDLLYKSHMALFFNKPDSAAIYMEDLLPKYELIMGPVTGAYYGKLLKLYSDNQQFEEGIRLCDKMLDYWKRNPFNLNQSLIQKEIHFTEKVKSSLRNRAKSEPRTKIERNKHNTGKAIQLNNSEYIRFNAKYNGIPIETWFDTGVSHYFFITKSLADEIGIKIIDKGQDSIQMVNGIPTKVFEGIIASVDLEDVKLYNIPVLIFNDGFTSHLPNSLPNDARSKIETTFSDKQITMGLPTMKMIGKIEFDREKRTVSFPENTEKIETNDSSNIFLIDNNPYIHFNINDLEYSGYLDTGSNDFVNMAFSFYEKNKRYIEIDSITEKKPLERHTITGSSFNIPHEFVKDAKIYFNSKYINYNNGEVVISDRNPHMNTYDGIVGANFFKRLGSKIIFDFDNMKIEGAK